MQLLLGMPILVLAVVPFIYMLLTVMAEKPTYLTALKFALASTVCRATQRMLE